jgi:hypothetical protein
MHGKRAGRLLSIAMAIAPALLSSAYAADLPGEGPRLGPERIAQKQIASVSLSLLDIRRAGMQMFTTPFNKDDGYGDGPMDGAESSRFPGNRPTINGTFLRVNGLDGQTCLECHSVIDASTSPPTLGIGGAGGSVSNAIAMPTQVDLENPDFLTGLVPFNGRFINPPALHGSGAVELLAREMTAELQEIRDTIAPGQSRALVSKGISFGTLVADADGNIDPSGIQGVDVDLVVKPFGRKGEFPTVRDFDTAALQFHFGMQPVEVVGADNDADGDGVVNEVLVGELSALHVFGTTLKPPYVQPLGAEGRSGFQVFNDVGCASCHVPALETDSSLLDYFLPGAETPYETPYLTVDLATDVSGYDPAPGGGIRVPLFSDLKRHDLGPAMQEDLDLVDEQANREFVTPRLWGIASTAPYMHSGQATTIGEAIEMHGGEASQVREDYRELPDADKRALHTFLQCLRLPTDAVADLLVDGPSGGGKSKAKGH